MPSIDSYTTALDGIASAIENSYEILSSKVVSNTDIASVISGIDKCVLDMDAKEISKRNEEVGRQIVLLSYLSERLEYFGSSRLDFTIFPAMGEVVKILILFTDKRKFNVSVRQINKIIKVLAEVDASSMKARYGLGYRYLRIFVTLVMYRSSCNASIVARFITRQVLLKAGNNK